MSADNSLSLHCADVRTLGIAQSHITTDNRTMPRTIPAQSSLKALAGAVLERTLPRTISAQPDETPRTLPAHCKGTAAHYPKPETEQEELTRLVRFCGEHYDFTEDEHIEALSVALADFEAALLCFRTMEAEIQAPANIERAA